MFAHGPERDAADLPRTCAIQYEWTAEGGQPQSGQPGFDCVDLRATLGEDLAELAAGHAVFVRLAAASTELRTLQSSAPAACFLMLPVYVAGAFWGRVGFDWVEVREPSEEQRAALRVLSLSIGAVLGAAHPGRGLPGLLRGRDRAARQRGLAAAPAAARRPHRAAQPGGLQGPARAGPVRGAPAGGASLGLAIFPVDDPVGGAEAYEGYADAALFRAKGTGRNPVQRYEPAMTRHMRRRLELEGELRVAVEARALEVWLQPQFDVADGRPLSAAAGRPLRLAVNVSPAQFHHHDVTSMLRDALSRFPVPEGGLEVELTESVLMLDPDTMRARLGELRALGTRIAIDDFGTGYSSLSALRRYPLDWLKIDRTFVADLARDPSALVIADTILAMARALGLRTMAEGVETVEQLEVLKQRGCTGFQGFLRSGAIPIPELLRRLQAEPVAAGFPR